MNLFDVSGVNDILIFDFQMGYEIKDERDSFTGAHTHMIHQFGEHYKDLNLVIPLSKHIEKFESTYNFFKESIYEFEPDYSFQQMNGVITETLSVVERNGLKIDVNKFNNYFGSRGILETEDMVYSEYNIFTSTGRPSNRFAKVNYSALNKDDGCRSSFISRFGKDGVLVGLDYRAYHPHIVANLINFKLDFKTDVYEYFAKLFHNKDVVSLDEIKSAKNQTFKNFYGGIDEKYLDIEFFKKTNHYINHRWEFFEKNGYVETPVFKRRITSHNITDPNPNKLFNYLLQAAETEFSIQTINRVNEFLKNKTSKVVLYTYDSILVDFSKDDGKSCIDAIVNLMMDNQFPVKCYVGPNYDDLCEISINR
jgi:hypothetical protein